MAVASAHTFRDKLQRELQRRQWGVRTLAREMATSAGQPDRVESLRRQLRKYLSTRDLVVPTVGTRHAIEDALQLERDALQDDDEESDQEMRITVPIQVSIDYDLLALAIERRRTQDAERLAV
jgi:hypothetical protein